MRTRVEAARRPAGRGNKKTRLTQDGVTEDAMSKPLVPPVRGKPGAPLRKPRRVMGDRAYHDERRRMQLSARAIATEIARRNTPHGSGLGVFRWPVEQTLSLMHQFKRLRVRDDRDDEVHEAVHDACVRDHLLAKAP